LLCNYYDLCWNNTVLRIQPNYTVVLIKYKGRSLQTPASLNDIFEDVANSNNIVETELVKDSVDPVTSPAPLNDIIEDVANDDNIVEKELVETSKDLQAKDIEDLVAWMESTEQELQGFQIESVHIDKLLQQIKNLVAINKDIAFLAPTEIMENIPSDEAFEFKDKLDGLQICSGELAKKGRDTLKDFQYALQLVEKFHECHDSLVDWMNVAETKAEEHDIIRLEHDLQKMRSILEKINQICQISQGAGFSTIEGICRFEAIVDQIQQKLMLSKQRPKKVTANNNLEKALPLAEHFEDLKIELVAWLNNMEQQIKMPATQTDQIAMQQDNNERLKQLINEHKPLFDKLNKTGKKLELLVLDKDAPIIHDILKTNNDRYAALRAELHERQHALLHFGQFQHALNELLIWISHIENTLANLRPIPDDPQLLEVKLAELNVLANDIKAHQSSVDTLNENDRDSLEALNTQWRDLLVKAANCQHELE
jgi:dystonin